MKRSIVIIVGLMFSSISSATVVNDTTIKAIMMDENNGLKLYLQVDNQLAPSGCRTNTDWPFVLDLSTEFGKRLHAHILSAHAAKLTVKIYGKDTCLVHDGVETLLRLEVL